MHFVYPAFLRPDCTGEIVVSFRDLPECLTSGADEAEALIEAADALEEAVAGRIKRGDDIPVPSAPQSGERRVAVPSGMAAKPHWRWLSGRAASRVPSLRHSPVRMKGRLGTCSTRNTEPRPVR